MKRSPGRESNPLTPVSTSSGAAAGCVAVPPPGLTVSSITKNLKAFLKPQFNKGLSKMLEKTIKTLSLNAV